MQTFQLPPTTTAAESSSFSPAVAGSGHKAVSCSSRSWYNAGCLRHLDSRQNVWAEPLHRNVWSLLRLFGDAEIASLILARHLVIEHSPVVAITDHKGDWKTPMAESVQAEFQRMPALPGS